MNVQTSFDAFTRIDLIYLSHNFQKSSSKFLEKGGERTDENHLKSMTRIKLPR